MRLICPGCGCIFSAESSSCEAHARQALRLITEIPAPANKPALNYIAMFRNPDPESRGLRWDKVVRLLGELTLLIKEAQIQFKGGVPRKNSVAAWAQAMERMIEHPPRQLPLKSHGYLTSVAYEIASELDRGAEVRRNQMERCGVNPKAVTMGAPVGAGHARESGTLQAQESRAWPAPTEPAPVSVEKMKEDIARLRGKRNVGGLLNSIGKK